jgi:hypothetical protein
VNSKFYLLGVSVVLTYLLLAGALAEVAEPSLDNGRFQIKLDGNSLRLEVLDLRNRKHWRQVSHPSPVVFPLPVLAQSPKLDGTLRGWATLAEVKTPAGNRFVLNFSPVSRELFLHVEIASSQVVSLPKGDLSRGDAIEVCIGDSRILLAPKTGGGALLQPMRFYEEKRPPSLWAEIQEGKWVLEAALPIENFAALDSWTQEQRFLAVALNTRNEAGEWTDRWPVGNIVDQLITYAQGDLKLPDPSGKQAILFDPSVRDLMIVDDILCFQTTLCAMSRGGAVLVPARVEISLDETTVHQRILPEDPNVVIHDITWPAAFVLDSEESWTVFPKDSGFILPTAPSHPRAVAMEWFYNGRIYDMNGTSSAGVGMIDRSSEDGIGFFTMVEPPWTAYYRSQVIDFSGERYRVPFFGWSADLGKTENAYELIHTFTEGGSYTSLAKEYRRHLQVRGRFKDFDQKVREVPLNQRVIGAPVIWLYSAQGPQSLVRIAESLKEDGFQKAILNLDPFYYETLGLTEYAREMESAIAQIVAMGFVASRYDQYRDTHPLVPGRIIYQQWNLPLYEEYALDYRGEKVGGFGSDARVISPESCLPFAEKTVSEDLARFPYNGRFFDCWGTISPYSDSDFRPGRETGVLRVQEIRKAVFSTMTKRGLVVGSEGAADWALAHLSWAEGAMSAFPAAWGEIPGWGMDDENEFYRFNLDEKLRIPFLQLVAGDCATITWRWEDGMDRKPAAWQKRNLLSVLYGATPKYFINPDGFGSLRELIKYTNAYVSGWNQRVGGKEMLSHRSLNESRTVQESQWKDGDGKLGVIVNFGRTAYRVGSIDVPPSDYISYEEDASGNRTFHPPPVPARDCDYRARGFSDVREDFERGFGFALRSDFAPNRAEYCGVTEDPREVLDGKFSVVVENKNPKLEPFVFLRSKPEQVPLIAGKKFKVSFTYRVLGAGAGSTLSLLGGNIQGPASWPLIVEDQATVSFTASPKVPNTSLEWVLNGTGRVVVDDVHIQKVN